MGWIVMRNIQGDMEVREAQLWAWTTQRGSERGDQTLEDFRE